MKILLNLEHGHFKTYSQLPKHFMLFDSKNNMYFIHVFHDERSTEVHLMHVQTSNRFLHQEGTV